MAGTCSTPQICRRRPLVVICNRTWLSTRPTVQNQEAGRTPKAKAKISSEGKKSTLSVSQLGHVIMLDHSSPTERFFPGRGVSPTPKQTTDNASSR